MASVARWQTFQRPQEEVEHGNVDEVAKGLEEGSGLDLGAVEKQLLQVLLS